MICIYFEGNSYQTISNLYNKEKVLGKTNWRDSTINHIITNELYKGDYLHGKRTKKPTYYENVVEPLISKELWEECQVQKRRNSRNYKRDKDYLFLQKLKCPKCQRILGGNATRKKNGNVYYYYQCHDCKITIREKDIEKESAEELCSKCRKFADEWAPIAKEVWESTPHKPSKTYYYRDTPEGKAELEKNK